MDRIFREEALEFRARGRTGGGGGVRLGGRWLPLLYWVTLVLVLAGGTALWFLRASERATGPAAVDVRNGSVVALLPLAIAPRLPQAEGLTVRFESGKSVAVTVSSVQPADGAAIRRAGLGATEQGGILLRGRLQQAGPSPFAASGMLRARAVVVLRSERVVDLLGRRFQVMLGEGGAQ